MERRQRIYIGADGSDRDAARMLYHRLKQAGFSPWFDSIDLRPGENWATATANARDQADVAVFLISFRSHDNEYLTEDMAAAVERQSASGRPLIIPIRVEPAPSPKSLWQIVALNLQSDDWWERLLDVLHQSEAPRLPLPEPPDALIQACLDGTCALYAGAGLSAPSGFPTWGPLVNDLIDWARKGSLIEPRVLSSLTALASSGDIDTAADELVALVRGAGADYILNNYLKSIFLREPPPLNAYHALLGQIPFSAALTTNFDQLLEATFPGRPVLIPSDAERLLGSLSKREFFLLKLYGSFERTESVLLAPAQYNDAIVGNIAFTQFIESLFVSRTLFFVGCSLEGIQVYLDGLKFHKSNRRHFALVGVSGRAWEARAQILNRRYGIEVIPYPSANDHAEVTAFLNKLVAQTTRSPSRTTADGGTPATRSEMPKLRRVRVNGIGLFDSFELDLMPNWNILLGNNGVGKSTILKAIAVGLCGRDAQPYAERLLKRGVPTGTIVLETTDGTEYITEILRTSGAAEIVVRPAKCLDAEGWLALGFPPLRLLTWDRSGGPMLGEGRSRPDAADVLPIISGGLDPRLDSLKQWILTLDYLTKDELSRGGSGDRPQRLLKDFFAIMGRLTGDLVLEFHDVEGGREVLVRTNDGIVPIEAVSQGMASLLGWVGVLMQRLYTVYDQDEKPTDKYAIVLIDEIDAHMHPEWQQKLVSLLSETFPNIQFIATTHSPLIVSGMDVQHITRLERDDDDRVTRVDVPADMTMGRADQVLTGPLFGLPTTLDVETQARIGEYQTLLGKRDRTEVEEAEFRRLERILEFRVPAPTERPAERRAQQLIEALLMQHFGEEFPIARADLLEKARQLLQEASAVR
jgi:hypothetical protein